MQSGPGVSAKTQGDTKGGMKNLISVAEIEPRKHSSNKKPTCGISYSSAQASVSRWALNEQQKDWKDTDGHGHAKRMLRGPSRLTQSDAPGMTRKDLRKVVGSITGHLSVYGHPHRIGIHKETLQNVGCRKVWGCRGNAASHVLFENPTLCLPRSRTLEVGEETFDDM